MFRKWLMVSAVCLAMALIMFGGVLGSTGGKATSVAGIFDSFYENYWKEQGPENGNLDIVYDEEVPL